MQFKLTGRKKRVVLWITLITLIIVFLVAGYQIRTRIQPPEITDVTATAWQVTTNNGISVCNGGWLKRNKQGLWELYVEGKPFERGVMNGKLTKALIATQESAFIRQIRNMIPSDFYLRFLKYFIYWFNRDLDVYVPVEYQKEIYGISLSASDSFEFIGSAYQRMLNYHSAHDIGHALQELSLVGCTSFGVWGSSSADSTLLIGRNFDFYAGDAFAEHKIVCFEKPDSGLAFMMVTWGGMIGAVSGMNEAGLTVTINAAASGVPWSARTPISILAREILQYAANLEEAHAIAAKRQTFISESLLIGSASDNEAAIIEKSPFGIALYRPEGNQIICANHFQSAAFANDPRNLGNIRDNASLYRSRRLRQLLTESGPVGYLDAARILRDQRGLGNSEIGKGNEKAVNQLIAHHSVIFMPSRRLVWVSTDPWQLGTYVCYDLSEIFHTFARQLQNADITVPDRAIPPDPFLESVEFEQFQRFRIMRMSIKQAVADQESLPADSSFFNEFIASNPDFYETWSLIGDYYHMQGSWQQAKNCYLRALSLTIPRWSEKEAIISRLADCNVRLKTN